MNVRLGLEVLEDRTAPTSFVGQIVLPPPSPFVQAAAQPSGGITIKVVQNTQSTTVDLDALFGPNKQMTIAGNSNPALVKASLSDGELTLSVAQSKSGQATITIGVIEPDGSSARETISITVQ